MTDTLIRIPLVPVAKRCDGLCDVVDAATGTRFHGRVVGDELRVAGGAIPDKFAAMLTEYADEIRRRGYPRTSRLMMTFEPAPGAPSSRLG